MARYSVTLWDTEAIVKLGQDTRTRRTDAANAAWAYARQSLAAFGKLDTQAAWAIFDKMAAWDDLLPLGECRSIAISNTGQSVTMTRDA